MPNATDDIFAEEDGVIEVGGSTPPDQSQPAGRDPAGPPPSLRAEWDGQNRCWVALHQGDRPLEKWRPPTKAEWDALRARGVVTRPSPLMRTGTNASVGQAAATTMVAEEPRTLFNVVKKNAIPFGLGIGATILGIKYVLPMVQKAMQPAPRANGADSTDDLSDDMGDDPSED